MRPMFSGTSQGNIVTTYLVALLADRLGDKMDLDKIWFQQEISIALKQQIQIWATEVNEILERSLGGRKLVDWAKKEECWNTVQSSYYTSVRDGIIELG